MNLNACLNAVSDPLVCVILGATATGKSAVALHLAQHFDGEIINFDSMQCYRALHVGVAKPDANMMQQIPHHLYDLFELHQQPSAALYAERARVVIKEVWQRGRLPILVGGSGFYLRALQYPLADIPAIPHSIREQVRLQMERHGVQAVHAQLAKVDPGSASRLAVGDRQRIGRAMEVWLHTQKPLSDWQRSTRLPENNWSWCKFGLWLPMSGYAVHIERRLSDMFAGGMVSESALFGDHPMRGIGYLEARQFAAGELTSSQALELAKRKTLQYAKRQRTWFRREKGVEWFSMEEHLRQDSLHQMEQSLCERLEY